MMPGWLSFMQLAPQRWRPISSSICIPSFARLMLCSSMALAFPQEKHMGVRCLLRLQALARPFIRTIEECSTNTTTVVMKAHETLDECVVAAPVVGNGFDGPRAAFSVETATRPAAPRANGRVKSGQPKSSGVPPAPSTRQAHQLWSFFFLLAELDAGQPGMGHHRERDVAIPAVPEAHFILIQARLPFGLFNALLNRITGRGHAHQRLQRGFGGSIGQIIGQL